MIESAENREEGLQVARRRRTNQSRIDALCREAEKVGLSYGYYVGLKKAGFAIVPKCSNKPYKDPHHAAWIQKLLSIAGRKG